MYTRTSSFIIFLLCASLTLIQCSGNSDSTDPIKPGINCLIKFADTGDSEDEELTADNNCFTPDITENDSDNDNVDDEDDNCPDRFNPSQTDTDEDDEIVGFCACVLADEIQEFVLFLRACWSMVQVDGHGMCITAG